MLFGQIFRFGFVRPLALFLDQNRPRPYKRPKNQLLNPLAFFLGSLNLTLFWVWFIFLYFWPRIIWVICKRATCKVFKIVNTVSLLKKGTITWDRSTPHDREENSRQNDVHDEPHDDTSETICMGLVLCLVVLIKSKSFKPRQPAGLTRMKSSKVKNFEASMVIFEVKSHFSNLYPKKHFHTFLE